MLIGAAEERCRELPCHLLHQRGVDTCGVEPLPVLTEVLAGSRHQQGTLAEQRQRVRDVGRAAAAPLVHRVDEEAQAQAVHVLGQEVFGELPGKRHQVVVPIEPVTTMFIYLDRSRRSREGHLT